MHKLTPYPVQDPQLIKELPSRCSIAGLKQLGDRATDPEGHFSLTGTKHILPADHRIDESIHWVEARRHRRKESSHCHIQVGRMVSYPRSPLPNEVARRQ